MTGEPDWKPNRRIRNRRAMARARLREPWCVICQDRQTESAHHVLSRSLRGDDVAAVLVGVCGDGTRGCHGLVEARDAVTLAKLGAYLRASRPDFVEYLEAKLGGQEAADEWMDRHLYA